jgi:predicted DCC family thiol-disulfide oxidoreductase YuxK
MNSHGAISPIIFFDGDCVLCNGFATFVLKHDLQCQFLFATLQSQEAVDLLTILGLEVVDLSSIRLLDHGTLHSKSEAALRIAGILHWPWKLFSALRWIPRPLRDAGYDAVGRIRYRFGRQASCSLANSATRQRLLDGNRELYDRLTHDIAQSLIR